MIRFRALRLTGLAVLAAFLTLLASQYLPSPAQAAFDDSDGDTAIDLAEQIAGSDPADAGSTPETTGTEILTGFATCFDDVDNDLDGLTDDADPSCTDSDFDIVSDPGEVLLGSDPNDPASFPEDSRLDAVLDFYGIPIFFCADDFDNDGDGLADAADPGCAPIASDSDPFDDATEKRYGSDPNDANSVPEHETPNPGSCTDGDDNDLDGLTDAADPACGSPANDDRADATVIPTLPYTDGPLLMKNATAEPDEPNPSCSFGGVSASVWYAYAPPDDAVLIADTAGSTFQTVLAVWRQDGSELVEVACGSFNPDARAVFDVSAGETYYFQIDGFPFAEGLPSLTFHLEAGNPPPNDDFVDAAPIAALPFGDAADLSAAGTEFGEPVPSCTYFLEGGSGTVWYTFTPAEDVLVVADTEGSDFQAFIGVWSQTVFGLHQVACASPFAFEGDARTAFEAEAGETYFIQVGRLPFFGIVPGPAGAVPGYSLQFNAEVAIPPANDDFAGAAAISGLPFSDTTDSLTSTTQPSEPTPSCLFFYELQSSVWYQYTPSADTFLVADTEDSPSYGNVIAIYEGASLNSLTEVGCAPPTFPYPEFGFEALAGHTYYFQVGVINFEFPFTRTEGEAGRAWRARAGAGDAAGPPPPDGGLPTDLVFNLDTLIVPDCASPEFSVDDPASDTFSFEEPPPLEGEGSGFPIPPPPDAPPDIVSVSGGSDAESVCLTVEFAGPIDPPDAITAQSIYGYVNVDADNDPATGFGAATQFFCPQPPTVGTEAELALFSGSGVIVPIYSFIVEPEGAGAGEDLHAIALFDDDSFDLIIPVEAIGGNDSFNFAMVFGSFFEPTDCAPNEGAIHSPDGSIVSLPGDVNCNDSPGPVDASLIL
ncbi:MAG: hypothetical protein U1B78_03840, partial [Dehalococcoidia bacterium]|nr:hypothetical protein [Dehalococcoidia bacterium]